jgi:hypothetical protein
MVSTSLGRLLADSICSAFSRQRCNERQHFEVVGLHLSSNLLSKLDNSRFQPTSAFCFATMTIVNTEVNTALGQTFGTTAP